MDEETSLTRRSRSSKPLALVGGVFGFFLGYKLVEKLLKRVKRVPKRPITIKGGAYQAATPTAAAGSQGIEFLARGNGVDLKGPSVHEVWPLTQRVLAIYFCYPDGSGGYASVPFFTSPKVKWIVVITGAGGGTMTITDNGVSTSVDDGDGVRISKLGEDFKSANWHELAKYYDYLNPATVTEVVIKTLAGNERKFVGNTYLNLYRIQFAWEDDIPACADA